MKRIALALVACAGLGFIAGRHNPSAPGALHPQTATPVVERQKAADSGAVVAPLVAKLLPGGGESESPSKAAPPDIEDGAISAGGNFRYSRSRRSWIPIDHGNRRYTHNRQPVTAAHLIAEHGHHPDSVAAWTQTEIEIAHANDHAAEVAKASSGHWEIQQVCGRRGCSNVRVWVQD
jgi:hypothetical protein